MPFEIEFQSDPDFMLVTWSGEFTEEKAVELGERMRSHPDFRANLNRIVDFRQSKFDLPPEELRRVAYAWDDMDHVHGDRKTAIIVGEVLSLSISTGFKFIKDRDAVKILITKDMDEAKAWVES